MLNKNLLKTEILKSPLLQIAAGYLKPGDEIITIQLTGSMANDLAISDSDIDIAFISTNSWELTPDTTGIFQSRHLHWWITPFDFNLKAYKKPSYIPMLLTGSYYMDFSESNTIWVNQKYQKLIDFLRKSKAELKEAIISNLCEYYSDISNSWLIYDSFPFKKPYIPLIDFYWESTKQSRNPELLKRAKESIKSKNKLSEDDQSQIKEALMWIIAWYNNTTYSYKQSCLDWQIQAFKILQEIKF